MDENHTVVATARGVFTSKGGVLESPETGVSIVIPAGAIDENIDQEIYFKVCRDNTILPPLDREKGRLAMITIYYYLLLLQFGFVFCYSLVLFSHLSPVFCSNQVL